MRLGNFSVEIPQGRELNSGYVAIRHNTKYAVKLSNFSDLRCDAEVEIDGKLVGVWRVRSKNSITIERPVHDTGCFTFYKFGTPEAEKAGLVRFEKLGLISVLFKLEQALERIFDPYGGYSSQSTLGGCSAGGTGLSGISGQEFRDVQRLFYNETEFVRIHLRLGYEADEPRPLTPVSTPVPPPLL